MAEKYYYQQILIYLDLQTILVLLNVDFGRLTEFVDIKKNRIIPVLFCKNFTLKTLLYCVIEFIICLNQRLIVTKVTEVKRV